MFKALELMFTVLEYMFTGLKHKFKGGEYKKVFKAVSFSMKTKKIPARVFLAGIGSFSTSY